MQFEVKAYRSGDAVQSLVREAESAESASRMAESEGYSVLSVRSPGILRFGAFSQIRKFPLALFNQELIALLDSGLPLTDAIEALSNMERRAANRTELTTLAADLRSGESFSQALGHQPQVFPALYVAVVRSSERSGNLSDALGRFVSYENQLEALKTKVINASIYPLVLIVVGGLVALFLLFYVMPKFSHVYDERTMQVGWASQLLLALGSAFEGRFALALVGFALALAGMIYVLHSQRLRERLLARLAGITFIGEQVSSFQLARFYRTAGMLLHGGFPVVSAFQLAGQLLNPALRTRLDHAIRMISEGLSISRAMDVHHLSSSIVSRLLTVGEQGGNMGDMMQRIADFNDAETARWIDWFTRLFEPLLMLAIGLMIGAVILLMYMPIFDLAGSLR